MVVRMTPFEQESGFRRLEKGEENEINWVLNFFCHFSFMEMQLIAELVTSTQG